jgi:hypothetical protein
VVAIATANASNERMEIAMARGYARVLLAVLLWAAAIVLVLT